MSTNKVRTEREDFRNSFIIDPTEKVEQDSLYDYKKVIFTYSHDPKRVSRYEKAGWEVVFIDEQLLKPDLGSRSRESSEDKVKLEPCVISLRGGHKAVYMRCLKTQRDKNELAKADRDNSAYERSAKSIKKQGNNITVVGSEVNLNNPDTSLE